MRSTWLLPALHTVRPPPLITVVTVSVRVAVQGRAAMFCVTVFEFVSGLCPGSVCACPLCRCYLYVCNAQCV